MYVHVVSCMYRHKGTKAPGYQLDHPKVHHQELRATLEYCCPHAFPCISLILALLRTRVRCLPKPRYFSVSMSAFLATGIHTPFYSLCMDVFPSSLAPALRYGTIGLTLTARSRGTQSQILSSGNIHCQIYFVLRSRKWRPSVLELPVYRVGVATKKYESCECKQHLQRSGSKPTYGQTLHVCPNQIRYSGPRS